MPACTAVTTIRSRKGQSYEQLLDRRPQRADCLFDLQPVGQTHRPEHHPGRRQAGDAGPDVHGRRRLHADQPERPLRVSLQGDRGRWAHRGTNHRRKSLGVVARAGLADPGRQLHRLGERLFRHHGRGAERRQQPVGDRAPAHRSPHAHDPVRVYVLLPDAAGRCVRRDPGGHPVRASGRSARHRDARLDGAPRRPDDVPLEDEHYRRHVPRRRPYARRHGGRTDGAAPGRARRAGKRPGSGRRGMAERHGGRYHWPPGALRGRGPDAGGSEDPGAGQGRRAPDHARV